MVCAPFAYPASCAARSGPWNRPKMSNSLSNSMSRMTSSSGKSCTMKVTAPASSRNSAGRPAKAARARASKSSRDGASVRDQSICDTLECLREETHEKTRTHGPGRSLEGAFRLARRARPRRHRAGFRVQGLQRGVRVHDPGRAFGREDGPSPRMVERLQQGFGNSCHARCRRADGQGYRDGESDGGLGCGGWRLSAHGTQAAQSWLAARAPGPETARLMRYWLSLWK